MDNEFTLKLKDEYGSLLPFLQRFSDEVTRQLQFIVSDKNIRLGVPYNVPQI